MGRVANALLFVLILLVPVVSARRAAAPGLPARLLGGQWLGA
jgi:hypothetical protein